MAYFTPSKIVKLQGILPSPQHQYRDLRRIEKAERKTGPLTGTGRDVKRKPTFAIESADVALVRASDESGDNRHRPAVRMSGKLQPNAEIALGRRATDGTVAQQDPATL